MIDVESYEREIAAIGALRGENRSMREQAAENRLEAAVLMWKLLRRSLVDIPMCRSSYPGYSAEQNADLQDLCRVVGLSRPTLLSYRATAALLETSREVLHALNSGGTTSWASLVTLLLSRDARPGLSTHIGASLVRYLRAEGYTDKQIRKAFAAYLKLPEIQDDIAQMCKEMFR